MPGLYVGHGIGHSLFDRASFRFRAKAGDSLSTGLQVRRPTYEPESFRDHRFYRLGDSSPCGSVLNAASRVRTLNFLFQCHGRKLRHPFDRLKSHAYQPRHGANIRALLEHMDRRSPA